MQVKISVPIFGCFARTSLRDVAQSIIRIILYSVGAIPIVTGIGSAQPAAPSKTNLLSYDIGQTVPAGAKVVTSFDNFVRWDWDTSDALNAFQRIFGGGHLASSWKEEAATQRSLGPAWIAESDLEPACDNHGVERRMDAAIEVATFMKPYDVFQASIFLPYLQDLTGRADFLPTAARHLSSVDQQTPYKGDLICPTFIGGSLPPRAVLRKTYGQAAILRTHDITLIIDNSFNPFRWDANIGDNRIMHREQSSLGLVIPTNPDARVQIATEFRDAMQGKQVGKMALQLVLKYDLQISIRELPNTERETFYDAMDRPCTPASVAAPRDLFEASVCRVMIGGGSSAGWKLVKSYLRTRVFAPSIQLSLGVVLDPGKHGVFPWREMEFMLAHYNYLDSHPPGFAPTLDEFVNDNTPIGNSNGRDAAWYRTRISAFHNPSLFDPGFPIVSNDAVDWVVRQPEGSKHLTGEIYLTNYIRNFVARRLLPGMSGEWGGCSAVLPIDTSIGSLGGGCDALKRIAARTSAQEPLSVYRVLLIPEVHGPFRVDIVVHSLKLNFKSVSGIEATPDE